MTKLYVTREELENSQHDFCHKTMVRFEHLPMDYKITVEDALNLGVSREDVLWYLCTIQLKEQRNKEVADRLILFMVDLLSEVLDPFERACANKEHVEAPRTIAKEVREFIVVKFDIGYLISLPVLPEYSDPCKTPYEQVLSGAHILTKVPFWTGYKSLYYPVLRFINAIEDALCHYKSLPRREVEARTRELLIQNFRDE